MDDCVRSLSVLFRQELCDREENSDKQSLARDNMAVAMNLPLMILCLELSLCLLRLESRKKKPCYPIAEAHSGDWVRNDHQPYIRKTAGLKWPVRLGLIYGDGQPFRVASVGQKVTLALS